MAEYDENKLTKLGHLKKLAEKIKSDYTTKAEFGKLQSKVEGLVSTGGEANVIEEIKVNNEVQRPEGKSVNITVPTSVTDLTDGKEYAKTEDVASQIKEKIGSVYKPGGSLDSADFEKLTAENVGTVYNISVSFNTDGEHFVENQEKSYPAGTNIVVVDAGSQNYKFDVLSGFVDLSDYATTQKLTEELAKKQPTGDYATSAQLAEKANSEHTHEMSDITGLELASDEEVQAMLEEVFTAEA